MTSIEPLDPDLIGKAIRIVAEGRAYTRQNFPIGSPGKYVGHTPADEFDAAVDTVTAAAATLCEENTLLSAALAATDEARAQAIAALATCQAKREQAVADCSRNVQALIEEQDARVRAVAALAEEEAELERLGYILRTEIGNLEREVERLRDLVAAADEYGDRHVIDMRADSFVLAHPLSCRATGLFECLFNVAATELPGPPALGKFAVELDGDGELVIGERIAGKEQNGV